MYINSPEYHRADTLFSLFNAAVNNALNQNSLMLFNSVVRNRLHVDRFSYSEIRELFYNYANLSNYDFDQLCLASRYLEDNGLL